MYCGDTAERKSGRGCGTDVHGKSREPEAENVVSASSLFKMMPWYYMSSRLTAEELGPARLSGSSRSLSWVRAEPRLDREEGLP